MTTLTYPQTVPSWVVTDLETLSKRGKLSGIPPQVVAGFARTESDYGNEGLAVNSSGYGGYFGLDASQRVGGLTPGTATFDAQAEVWATDFAHELQDTGGTWSQAIRAVSGGTTDLRYQEQSIFHGAPYGDSGELASDLVGSSDGKGASGALADSGAKTLTGVVKVGTFMGAAATVNKSLFIRIALGLFGAILLLIAMKELSSNHGAIDTMTSVPGQAYQTVKRGAKKGAEVAAAAG